MGQHNFEIIAGNELQGNKNMLFSVIYRGDIGTEHNNEHLLQFLLSDESDSHFS